MQVSNLRRTLKGESPEYEFEPVRAKGLLTAVLLVSVIIAGFIGLAFQLRSD